MLKSLSDYASPVAVLILAGVMLFTHFDQPGVRPAPVINTDAEYLKLGNSFGHTMPFMYGDAWVQAGKDLADGHTAADSIKALQARWDVDRKASYTSQVVPAFSKVLAPGTEPADATQRASASRAWMAFGRGLKGETK